MRWVPLVASSSLLVLAMVSSSPRPASAVGISAEFDSCGVDTTLSSPQTTTVNFNPYKVPQIVSQFARRDLEFLWSDNYATLFGRPLNAPRAGSTDTDLDLLGLTICSTPGTGAFGFPIPFIQLVYDYLRAPGLGRHPSVDNYNTNPADTMGFNAGQPTYGNRDRNHADTYIFAPRFNGDPLWQGGGQYGGDAVDQLAMWPSFFLDADEDVSSGHPASIDSTFAYRLNSISIPGPRPSQVGVAGASDWTRPRALAPIVFNHEFQHMINAGRPGSRITEILSAAAEALTGEVPEAPAFDVPYTWGLLRGFLNYQAYRSFSAYLTYNFRGTDTTFAGRSDDLMWRWARATDRSLVPGLGKQLLPDSCAECVTKTYFNGLSATDRVSLLIHNWRVANYVNKPSLAEGQYGFPPLFGFDPNIDVGNWQDIDTGPGAVDTVNIEMEVKLNSSHITRELSLAGRPTNVLNPANAHAVALSSFGSEYWVVRSDPSLWSADRDLVIRIMPEGWCAVRLMASAIAYSQQDLPGGQSDSLWNHPEWAQLAVAPKWINLEIPPGVDPDPLELVVPNFGQTHKAALIVISAGAAFDGGANSYELPYRLNLTLRTAPFQNPNPAQVTTFTAPYSGLLPTWSPTGDELAFCRTDATSGTDQVYRAPVSGGAPALLFPQPVDQFYPDWSPRGDWVSFDQATAGGGCDIWAVSPINGQSRRLTSSSSHELNATFSPNGQQLVYLRIIPSAGYELRRVNLDGSNDKLLVARTSAVIHPPRWAPNGPRVFFAVQGDPPQDSLYAVEALGPETGLVTPIAALPAGVFHFDPPRGNGRWALESRWQPLSCGAPSGPSFQRIALHDTPAGTAETIFSRPTSTVSYPRWSWDGTRVAFSASRPQPVIPPNVFVGQVSYNHAPSFVDLNDQTPTVGQAFQMDVIATDPDGESLTYEAPAVFLPPGASFDHNTRRFTWPNPTPQGAEFFVVFRALDPSGAVSHRVIRLYVQDPPAGGCPFVDTYTATGWREENSVLGRSLTSSFALDSYRLRFTPDVRDGHIRLRLRENEQEYTTLDQVRLLAVDHTPDVRAYTVGNRVLLGTRVPAYRVTTNTGSDITALVSGAGGDHWGSPGDTLFVQMTAPRAGGTFGATGTQDGGGGEGGLEGDPKEMQIAYEGISSEPASPMSAAAVDEAVLNSTGILIEVPDGAGGWRTLTRYYPRRYRDETVVDSLGAGSCRLIFMGRHRLHFIGRYARSATAAAPQALALLAAQHSRLGDAKPAVAQSAGTTTTLIPGDTLALEFATRAVPAGHVRAYFLLSTGVYSATAPLARRHEGDADAAPRPTRFALAQNQPNPFERTTTIRFELPRETAVRLEVFDLQGRRIAVLADGFFPAGYHTADWDRRDVRGTNARPGVYLYRLTANEFRDQKKMLLFK